MAVGGNQVVLIVFKDLQVYTVCSKVWKPRLHKFQTFLWKTFPQIASLCDLMDLYLECQ